MSKKTQPKQYADAKGSIIEDFDGNTLVSMGTTVPADGTAGYSVGGIFAKRLGAAGAQLYINEGTVASSAFKALGSQAATGLAALAVAGVAAGYKLARGSAALDGSNPTPIVTGLTTIVAAIAVLNGTAAPGVGTSVLTVNYTTGTLNVYGWKVTSNIDNTLIASTGTDNFDWIAVGT